MLAYGSSLVLSQMILVIWVKHSQHNRITGFILFMEGFLRYIMISYIWIMEKMGDSPCQQVQDFFHQQIFFHKKILFLQHTVCSFVPGFAFVFFSSWGRNMTHSCKESYLRGAWQQWFGCGLGSVEDVGHEEHPCPLAASWLKQVSNALWMEENYRFLPIYKVRSIDYIISL